MLTSRTTGREMRKRDIHLIDDSNTMVRIIFTYKNVNNLFSFNIEVKVNCINA